MDLESKAYENEQEYRFLQMFQSDQLPPEVKLRSRSYSLIKYREFDWRSVAARALKEIRIGPAADKEKAFEFVRDCLQEAGIGSVDLTDSRIPYRAL